MTPESTENTNYPVAEDVSDVAIIGAGIIGNFVAYELSNYDLKIGVIEKEEEVGFGVSKGHDAILHVLQLPFASLKSKLCLKGNKMYDEVAGDLSVPLKRTSAVLLTTSKFQTIILPLLRFYIKRNVKGFNVRIIRSEELSKLEPNLRNPRTSLVVDGYGLIDPFEMHWRLRESNELNGVKYEFGNEFKEARKLDDGMIGLITEKGVIKTRFVVNATGLGAHEVASKFGDKYEVEFDKGISIVYATAASNNIITPLALRQRKDTKGGGALLTVDDKSLWGPNLVAVSSPSDTGVSESDVEEIEEKFGSLFKVKPTIRLRAFAGVRSISDKNDFIIERSNEWGSVIHCVGISSPGYTSAPAIAKLVVEMLSSYGLKQRQKVRKRPVAFVNTKRILESKDSSLDAWGKIICPETGVSEGEIREAVKRGARTLDAIAQRTKFTFGLNQGTDCLFRVTEIMADELGVPPTQITKKDESSWFLA